MLEVVRVGGDSASSNILAALAVMRCEQQVSEVKLSSLIQAQHAET